MDSFEPIRLIEIVADEVGTPRDDGTRGSALYEVPIRISSTPPPEWSSFFSNAWDRPPRFTTMHRPGIASVRGDRIVLSKTTLEEVEKYHRETLRLAVEVANKQYSEFAVKRAAAADRQRARVDQHRAHVAGQSRSIRFD